MNVDRSKIIAILTGLFSLLLGALYLMLVQLLDLRGEMISAPVGAIAHELLFQGLLSGRVALGYS